MVSLLQMHKTLIIIISLLLTACSYVPSVPGFGVHKIDVQQGNYVTQDMVAKLKPGMTKSQVRFILGTPLIVDVFHTDRWDYVYSFQHQGKITEHRRMAVIFEGDSLKRIDGDVIPAPAGKDTVPNAKAELPAAVVPEAPKETVPKP